MSLFGLKSMAAWTAGAGSAGSVVILAIVLHLPHGHQVTRLPKDPEQVLPPNPSWWALLGLSSPEPEEQPQAA